MNPVQKQFSLTGVSLNKANPNHYFIYPLVLLLLGLCVSVEAQTQPNLSLLPTKFSFRSGGMSGRQTVEWNGKALIYEETKYGAVVTNRTIQPTEKQWREFWVATEKIKLSNWKPHYDNPDIMDGWVWIIEITRGPQKISTMGRNAVPDDADVTKTSKESLPNKTFNMFKSALEGLIGFKLW